MESHSACSVTLYLLKSRSRLTQLHACSLLCISPPLSKKQATAGKTQKIFPQTMYTCAQRATVKNTNLMWKRLISSLPLSLSPCQSNKLLQGKPKYKHFHEQYTLVHSWPPLRIQTLYGRETCQHSTPMSFPLSKKQATAGKTQV